MRLRVKDWFHAKKMQEKGRDVINNPVFAILGETEKAYKVFIADTIEYVTYWCPKSCVTEVPNWGKYGVSHRETLTDVSFEEVLKMWKSENLVITV